MRPIGPSGNFKTCGNSTGAAVVVINVVSRQRTSPSPQWPFWLLLGAWLCANSPQVVVFSALTWMAEARSFSHQQRLTVDVARLLAGEKASRPIADAVARAQEQLPAKPTPPIPADTVLKKIVLSLERTIEVLPAALRGDSYHDQERSCPEARRSPPPHGPPRFIAA